MRLLLIEDDVSMARGIELTLHREGFSVHCSDLGEEGFDLGDIFTFDAIILDLNLPDVHGYDVLKRLRAADVAAPILILSAQSSLDDKVKGLGFGADDYLTKPFDTRELVARLHAIVRRARRRLPPVLRFGRLTIDRNSKAVSVDGEPVHLTGKEYAVLELLSRRKGTTLSKETLFNHLYGGRDEPEAKIIDVFICKLRKKLAAATGGEHYIDTIWGRGYVLRHPPRKGVAA